MKCKILSSNAQSLRCSAKSESRLRRCGLGGLEAAAEVSTQVFGPLLARYGVYALGSCVVTLQACVLENTGRTGGIGARVGGDSQVQLIGCMVRCNDIGASVDHRGQLTVTGCTLESNAWAAWHTGPFPQKCKASMSDNTVIGREWFNDRRPSSDPPTYLKCCGARGCSVCYDSIDNRLAEKELMERAVLLNPELKDGSYDSEADWQVCLFLNRGHSAQHYTNLSFFETKSSIPGLTPQFCNPDSKPTNLRNPRVIGARTLFEPKHSTLKLCVSL